MIKAKELSKKERALGRKMHGADAAFWKQLELHTGKLETSCWVYKGARFANGYGRVYKTFEGKRVVKAHRYAYMLAKRVPKDLVCHHCDNRLCCNPAHLYDGTHAQNMQDTIDRKTMPRGESHSRAVLTNRQVANIRMLVANLPRVHNGLLCQLYKISKQTLHRILNGEQYPEAVAAPIDADLIAKYEKAWFAFDKKLRAAVGETRTGSKAVWIFRNDADRQLCFYYHKVLRKTQAETAEFFKCSRNAMRNAVDKALEDDLPVLTQKEFDTMLDVYWKFRNAPKDAPVVESRPPKLKEFEARVLQEFSELTSKRKLATALNVSLKKVNRILALPVSTVLIIDEGTGKISRK